MVDEKTEDKPKDEKAPEPAKKDSKASKDSAKGTSPNEDKSLPQGIYGGPATADNPTRASVVFKDRLDK